jgi:hypothetical protein
MWATSEIFKKVAQSKRWPNGPKRSPNLATLLLLFSPFCNLLSIFTPWLKKVSRIFRLDEGPFRLTDNFTLEMRTREKQLLRQSWAAGWPDWVNFRLSGDTFLWKFFKNGKSSTHFLGYHSPRKNLCINHNKK